MRRLDLHLGVGNPNLLAPARADVKRAVCCKLFFLPDARTFASAAIFPLHSVTFLSVAFNSTPFRPLVLKKYTLTRCTMLVERYRRAFATRRLCAVTA